SCIILLSLLLSNAAFGQEHKEVDYKEGNQALNGMVSSNAGKNLPGVLILPAWKGIGKEAKDAAIALEKEGYIAFIADIYGVGNTPTDNAASSKLSSQYKNDYQAYQKRIRSEERRVGKGEKTEEKTAQYD